MYVLLCTILLLKVHFYTFFLSKSPSDHIRKKESRTGEKKEQSVLRSLRKQRKSSFAIRNRRRHSIATALLGSMIANKNKLMQFTLLSKAITREFPKPPGHGDSKWNAKTQLSTISSSSEIRWKGCSRALTWISDFKLWGFLREAIECPETNHKGIGMWFWVRFVKRMGFWLSLAEIGKTFDRRHMKARRKEQSCKKAKAEKGRPSPRFSKTTKGHCLKQCTIWTEKFVLYCLKHICISIKRNEFQILNNCFLGGKMAHCAGAKINLKHNPISLTFQERNRFRVTEKALKKQKKIHN